MRVDYITDCINKVNKEFVKGKWNFTHERNFQCLLFAYLRKSSSSRVKLRKNETIELVHADFNSPATPDADTYLDIAIMEEKSALAFLDRYGKSERARNSDLLLEAAIQIKYVYSAPDEKKIKQINNDIEGLDKLLKCRKVKRGYFLLYVDEREKWTRIIKGEPVMLQWKSDS